MHLHVTAYILTPDVLQVLCLTAGLERFSMPVLVSVTAITIGTGLTAFMEVGATTFDLVGFVAFTASAVLEALRVILVQVPHFEVGRQVALFMEFKQRHKYFREKPAGEAQPSCVDLDRC